MNVSVACIAKTDHLMVEVTGDWTEASTIYILDTAKREATARGLTRILFDLRQLSLPDREMTRYYGGKYLAEIMPPPFRVATIGGRPEMVNHFAEIVAQNRGAQLRAFIELEPAMQWLLT